MNKITLCFALCVLVKSSAASQTLSDSLATLYIRYSELSASHNANNKTLGNISSEITELKGKVNDDISIVKKQSTELKKELENSTKFQTNTLKEEYERQKSRIQNSAEFAGCLQTNLASIKGKMLLGDYNSEIQNLNNPSSLNQLGFSFNDKVAELIKAKIIKNRPRINGTRAETFLSFSKGILESPILEAASSVVPVVSSVVSIIDLISGFALNGDDISYDDVNGLQLELKNYIVFYEKIGAANAKLNRRIDPLAVRLKAVEDISLNHTKMIANSLKPESLGQLDTSLNRIITHKYNRNMVDSQIKEIENELKTKLGNTDSLTLYRQLLTDPRIRYSNFTSNEASFLLDEVKHISSEYTGAYDLFQDELDMLFKECKIMKIGIESSIDATIVRMRDKLNKAEAHFQNEVLKIGCLEKHLIELSK